MSKHIGVLFAWIIGAGIALYVIRNAEYLFDGLAFLADEAMPWIDTLFE